MNGMTLRTRRIAAFALLLAAVALPAAARPLVVIVSTSDALPPGKIIDSDTPVTLPQDTRVTLVGPDGKNLEMQGPYSGKPALGAVSKADDPTLVSRLSRLFETTVDSAMPGGVRGAAEAPPPGPWSIDIDHGGTYCVAGIETIRLWRRHAGNSLKAAVRPADADHPVTLSWSADDVEVPWPADLPPAAEAKYLVRRAGASLPTVIVLRRVPAGLPNDAERAAWMGEHGCAPQARRLLQGGH
jgi:hypothetical protein